MAYTTSSSTSYGQRLTGSLKNIGSGFIMFIIGTVVLFWNEGNFVKTQKSLKEAEGVLVRVSNVSEVDPSLNGKLIHATALADSKETLTDDLFGVSETAISISRTVEYYQYEEQSSTTTKDKIGGGQEHVTTYTYEKKWTSQPIDSETFTDSKYKKSNFALTSIAAKSERAKEVSFGGYRLPGFIISSISGSVPAIVNLTDEEIEQWKNVLARDMSMPYSEVAQMVQVNGNIVYFGKSPSVPTIGDVRVTLTKVMPCDISIIAKVVGSTFEEYTASNGKTVSQVAMGTVSSEKMFADAHSSNKLWTWVLRLVGVILVISGLRAMFSILPALFKIIPFLGKIIGAGVGFICGIGGFVWSLVVISIAWLTYRPLIGIPMLLLAIAGIWYLRKRGKEAKVAEENTVTSN